MNDVKVPVGFSSSSSSVSRSGMSDSLQPYKL